MKRILSFEEFVASKSVEQSAIQKVDKPVNEIQPHPSHSKADYYKDKLLKLLPAEVVGAFLFTNGIFKGSNVEASTLNTIQWGVFIILIILNILYLRKTQQNRWKQVIFTSGAFVIWVAAIGGPFTTLHQQDVVQLLSSIALPLYTLAIPFFIE